MTSSAAESSTSPSRADGRIGRWWGLVPIGCLLLPFFGLLAIGSLFLFAPPPSAEPAASDAPPPPVEGATDDGGSPPNAPPAEPPRRR